MSIEIKSGILSDFFLSAKETAREIDAGKKLTKKNTIWVDPKDLIKGDATLFYYLYISWFILKDLFLT